MNSIPECFYRTSIKGLVLNSEKKFLLVKEANGKWELPGGGLEHGEQAEQCLHREIKEEMGLGVLSFNQRPFYFYSSFHQKFGPITNIVYQVELTTLDFTPSDECVEIAFHNMDEALKKNLAESVKEFLKHFDTSLH